MMAMRRGRLSKIGTAACMLMLLLMASEMAIPSLACPPDDRNNCSNCILKRFEINCPACVPTMRCMARCLWGGISRKKCIKKCDCNSDFPRLTDCKKCLSPCKCSCSSEI